MADREGGQGGGRQYSEEDVEVLLNETAKRAANEALRSARPTRQQQREEREERDIDEELGMSSKLVKQLQTTVSVFNTLKEFSSNPLQKAIESKVGDLAAGVIEQAFTRPSGPPPKRDLIETFLNSQLGFGLGQGLGQRAPEFVESIGRMFGKDKAEQMIDGVIGKYGSKGGGSGGGSGGSSGGGTSGDQGRGQLASSSPDAGPESGKQSEKEILLSLDPNNPEHVSAYAETQGGISIDVARKMLMIHQDEFIKQMKMQGANVEELSKIRGSHIDKPASDSTTSQPHSDDSNNPIPTPPVQEPFVQEPFVQPPDYADFREVSTESQQETHEEEAINQSSNEKGSANQLSPQLVQFTEDIGKIMGDMVGKIESMNNTIFVLQNELSEIKSGRTGAVQPPTTPFGQTPGQPTIINQPIERMNIDPILEGQNITEPLEGQLHGEHIPEPLREHIPGHMPEPLGRPIDNLPESIDIDNPSNNMTSSMEQPIFVPRKSSEFFEEIVQDASDFERELQEEARVAAKKFEEAMQQQKKSTEQLPSIQPAVSVPPMNQNLTPPSSPPIQPVPPSYPPLIENTPTIPINPPLMNIEKSDEYNNPNIDKDNNPNIDKDNNPNIDKDNNPNIDKDIQNIQIDKTGKKYVKPIHRKNTFTPSFKSNKEKDSGT